MDRNIVIFYKRKNRESFMRSVNALIILSYIGLRKLVQKPCVLIIYQQYIVGFHIFLRCNRVMVKKSFLKNLC